MSTVLSLIALAIAALAAFVLDRKGDSPTEPRRLELVAPALFLTLTGVAALLLRPHAEGVGSGWIGIAVGTLASTVAAMVSRREGSIAPLALAVATSAAVHPLGELAQLGTIVGFGVGAWFGRAPGGESAAVMAAFVIGTDLLAAQASALGVAATAGSALGLGTVVALLLAGFAPDKRWVRGAAGAVVTLGAGALVGQSLGRLASIAGVVAMGVLAAIVVHLLSEESDEGDSIRPLLGVLVVLGLATAAFGIEKGLGMGMAGAATVATLLAFGTPRGILVFAPLMVLVLYRVFRERYPDSSRAIDIGQHYAMVGLALGIVLPLLASVWSDRTRAGVAFSLWGLLLVAAPIPVAAILGPKGAIGFLLGLGFAAVVQSLRAGSSLASASLAASVAGATAMSYGWLDPLLALTRSEKLRMFAFIAIGVLLIGGGIAALGRTPKAEAAR